MRKYKTVLMPIEVPEGIYCWGGSDHFICGYFDCTGGHPICALNVGHLAYDKEGYVRKPTLCLGFKEEKK